nr:uncharacterized protein LOC126534763 [Dermacentor andersoni]
MHQGGPTSRLTRTPTGATSRASLDSIGTGPGPSVPAMSSHAVLSSSFQDRGHQDVVKAPHDLDTARRSRASSAASISAAPAASVGPLPTAEAERSVRLGVRNLQGSPLGAGHRGGAVPAARGARLPQPEPQGGDQYSSAPPAAPPTNAAGNFPGQPFPIAAPGGPYVQQPQLVEPRPELAQPTAPDDVYPEPVQHIDSPYPLAVQRVHSAYPQPPPQPALGTVGIDPGQGSYDPVALGAPVPQPAPAYTGSVDFQAEPWGAGPAAVLELL